MLKLHDLLEEFDKRLGSQAEPEILTLTEKLGFVAQKERFHKRLAIADTSDYKLIGLHDIAFNPYLLWAGAVAQNTEWEAAIISPLYPTFRVRRGHSARFVNHLLCDGYLRSRYDAISYGSVPRKRRAAVKDFLDLQVHMPVPSLEEQERIATLLDEADGLRKLRRGAEQRTRALIPALLDQMFGNLATNPKRWPLKALGILAKIDSPLVDPRLAEYRDLPHVGPDRIESETGKLSPTRTALEDGLVSGKFLFDESHVLYSKIRPYLRKAALPDYRGLCSADIYPLRPKQGEINREYLWAVLLSECFTKYAAGHGERTSIPKVNRAQLSAFQCPLPPLSLQEQFGARVKEIRELERDQTRSSERLDALFDSLLHRAFAGAL